MKRAEEDAEQPAGRAHETRGRLSRHAVYGRLIDGLEHLKRVGGLPSPVEAQDIWGDIWYAEAHNSTALEGNTLVRREVEVLLREGRAIGNKQLADYLEVQGYARAAEWVYGQALMPTWAGETLLTVAEVREVHRVMMTPVWDVAPHPQAGPLEGPGHYRRHDIATFPGGMVPPPWTAVDAAMQDWVTAVCAGPVPDCPFPEVLADWFACLERIHPFLDGNGRTGRLLTNLILVRLGYPPAIIYRRQRAKYLACLRRADVGSLGPLGELLARAILDTLYRFIVPAVAGPRRLVPIAALADATVTQRALRAAAMRGRLKAQRGDDGQWYSMRQWVEEYKSSRRQGSHS